MRLWGYTILALGSGHVDGEPYAIGETIDELLIYFLDRTNGIMSCKIKSRRPWFLSVKHLQEL